MEERDDCRITVFATEEVACQIFPVLVTWQTEGIVYNFAQARFTRADSRQFRAFWIWLMPGSNIGIKEDPHLLVIGGYWEVFPEATTVGEIREILKEGHPDEKVRVASELAKIFKNFDDV